MKNDYPVDIVMTWVDGNDLEWQEIRNKYISQEQRSQKSVGGDARYIDDGMLHFIFRGIEKYLPWINKIHFVTFGHLPKWLNVNHPKIHIVNHQDFMPSEYLPTFAGNPLSLNFHRIKGLSEHFIYVNDDMYFLSPIKKELFFKNGLPCDMAVQEVVDDYSYHDVYYYTVHNDLCLLNNLINKKQSMRKHLSKWFSFKYGFKNNLKTFCLKPFNLFSGIYEPHTPAPYLKSTYEEVWKKISNQLNDASLRKFRSPYSCSENVFRYYQMATGQFYPINRDKFGCLRIMSSKDLPNIINNSRFKIVCINYSDKKSSLRIKDVFKQKFPEKSSFEL